MSPALGKQAWAVHSCRCRGVPGCTYLYWAIQGYSDLYKKQGYTYWYYHATFRVIDRKHPTTNLQGNSQEGNFLFFKRIKVLYYINSSCLLLLFFACCLKTLMTKATLTVHFLLFILGDILFARSWNTSMFRRTIPNTKHRSTSTRLAANTPWDSEIIGR